MNAQTMHHLFFSVITKIYNIYLAEVECFAFALHANLQLHVEIQMEGVFGHFVFVHTKYLLHLHSKFSDPLFSFAIYSGYTYAPAWFRAGTLFYTGMKLPLSSTYRGKKGLPSSIACVLCVCVGEKPI